MWNFMNTGMEEGGERRRQILTEIVVSNYRITKGSWKNKIID